MGLSTLRLEGEGYHPLLIPLTFKKISGTEYKRYDLYQSGNTSFYVTSDYTYKGIRVLGYYSRGIRDVVQNLDSSSNGGIKITSEKPWERFYGQLDAKIGKFSLGYKGSVNNYFVNFHI